MRPILALILFCALGHSVTHAQGTSVAQRDRVLGVAFQSVEDQLVASRAVVAEAGWNVEGVHARDAAAVLWMLARRYARPHIQARYPTFAAFVTAYSTPLRTQRTARARAIAALGPADVPRPPLRGTLTAWQKVQAFVHRFARGRIEDPCHGRADHFGSATDGAPTSFVRVDCGRTENVYYRVGQRKTPGSTHR